MSDNWWTDYSQNKRLSGLEQDLGNVSAALSQSRASQARLRAELSKVSGSIEQRLVRLSAAFDAFVEISDLRVTLGLFDRHGRVRHQAKQLLLGQSIVDVDDAEGYWLAPALVAVRGVADGAVDPDALALAVARDPLRAKAFHVLAAAVLGGRLPVLDDILTSVTDPVPNYQRAAWLLAADGFFGPVAWERCATLLSAVADESLADTVRQLAVPTTVVEVPKDLDGGGELATALQACERLTALRASVTSTLDAYSGEPAATKDPLVRRSLDLLIDEGSPVELPLLARERELRATIENRKTASATWDSPAGSATDLLREDLMSAVPDRRALALRASADVVMSVAEKYAETARTPAPDALAVRTRYGQVTITPTEADRTTLEKAVATVAQMTKVESRRRQAAIGAFAVALGFVVLAVFAGWGWAIVAAAAIGIGVYQQVVDARDRRSAAETTSQLRETLRNDVANRVEMFAKTRRELQDRQTRVTEDIAALRAVLSTVNA
ncbi:hypothetical protein [Actinophytocola sp.]|uniref:hypothetical protein n=1 Tax=Actinophytocola sp. TaxID=1872138 RepID=UPI002D5BA65A|nr:hypothetical protein [Actinophytocola sp.]HYQ65912.1 hypothetical protein [Actinophytocola sp.]